MKTKQAKFENYCDISMNDMKEAVIEGKAIPGATWITSYKLYEKVLFVLDKCCGGNVKRHLFMDIPVKYIDEDVIIFSGENKVVLYDGGIR